MTSAPPASRSRPTDASNLKLHLTTLLSATYLIAWWAFHSGDTKTTEQAGPAASAESDEAPSFVWYDALPPTERPKLILPPGILLATARPASIGAALPDVSARPVRVTSRRPGRVRTRSS